MAMVRCPECGQSVSDREGKCSYCGCPIRTTASNQEDQNASGTLVVYGYTGWFMVKPKLKIYLNGEYVGDVSHKAKTREIPITGPTTVEIKCSIRSTAVRLYPNKHNEIYTEFDRTTGSILAELRSY